jgi:hypothetical protein
MRTARETAILLAVILNRSGHTRARISGKTIKLLALRQNLRSAFVVEVVAEIAEFGWILFELGSGGFGAVQAKTLEAAKSVTAKRLLTDDERKASRRDNIDWVAFELEARPPQEDSTDDE